MKKLLILPILLLSLSVIGQNERFSKKFDEAFELLENENYKKALPILEELLVMDPDNGNVNFFIGNCYMNTPQQELKAIPYYEAAVENKMLTVEYNIAQSFEKKAPVELLIELGKAYHLDYQFDKAIETYDLYEELLNHKEDKKDVRHLKRVTYNAQQLMRNPVEITVRRLDSVNTEFAEYRPKLNAEENILMFTSRRKNTTGGEIAGDGKYFEDIYISRKDFGKWSAPKKLEMPVNTDGHDACLYISPDNSLMYLYRFDDKGERGGGIYETRLHGDKWVDPILLDASINSSAWETDASMDVFGNTIFFTSDRDGIGERDIWMMKKLPNGQWATAQNLGRTINTRYDEESPYLHPDGKTLYFSSKGHNSMGGFDVFKSELQPDGSWGSPVNLGYPINTTGDDVFYFPSTNGKRAYFSSYRDGGLGDHDLYMLTLEGAEEKALAIYKGMARDSSGNVISDLLIYVVDVETGEEVGVYRPNDQTGKFLFILQPGRDYEITYEMGESTQTEVVSVDEEGGMQEDLRIVVKEAEKLSLWSEFVDDGEIVILDDRKDTISRSERDYVEKVLGMGYLGVEDAGELVVLGEEGGDAPVTQDAVNEVLDKGGILALPGILFKYDKDVIKESSLEDLNMVVNYMKEHPDSKLHIIGHTDSKGAEHYNQVLSLKRSKAVRKYIIDNTGVKASHLTVEGKGESKPIAPNENADGSDNPEGRQTNRRVEFVIRH